MPRDKTGLSTQVPERAVRALERIAIVLGAVAAGQMPEADLSARAKRLRRFGFSNIEIAQMLGSTPNAIGVALWRGRGKKNRQPASEK
jgi:hypothetical protein